jgi:hypothetical protein
MPHHVHPHAHRRARHRPFTLAWWMELAVPARALRFGTLTDRDCADTMKLAHW